MDKITVSAVHSLKLIPISLLSRFARIKSKTLIVVLGDGVDLDPVPGSVKVSTTSENGKVSKKITFKVADVSAATADKLQGLKVSRFVAVYRDERHNERVSGSPDYPLSLDYTPGDGVFSVTLTGEDTGPDGFTA